MGRKLYVGNLSFTATEDELRDHFSQAGTPDSVAIIKDRMTGRSRGFGFVGSRSAIVLKAVTFDSSSSGGGGAAGEAGAGADAADGAAAGAASRPADCWLPIIQPAINPKTTPATPKAIASDFIVKIRS